MRKRKTVNQYEEHDNNDEEEENEEPEEFQDSGDDWDPSEDASQNKGSKKRGGRTSLASFKKRQKNTSPPSTDQDDDDDDDEDNDNDDDDDSQDEKNDGEVDGDGDGDKSDSSQSKDVPKYFHSGNFVLQKSEVKWDGDKVISSPRDLIIWRIDGKALLQKYVPTDIEGKVLHKCTCSYSGWSVDNRDNYYPVTEILDRNPKVENSEIYISFDVNDLIKVRDKN